MGVIWRPELCLGNALFDTLKPKEQADLDFESISTTSYKDPIFNNTWHQVWIDHILYTKNTPVPWVSDAFVYKRTEDGTPLWDAYPHASDHFAVVATVTPPPIR
jgi:hypothetical protein